MVHPLNQRDYWEGGNTETAGLAVAPPASPDEGMLVLIPVGGGTFNGLLDLGPGFEPAAFCCAALRVRARERSTFHQGSMSGSGAASLPPRPLRTVRASPPAYGSSLRRFVIFAARKIRSWMRCTAVFVTAHFTVDHVIGSRPSVCSVFTV